jgi:hypothetical protein
MDPEVYSIYANGGKTAQAIIAASQVAKHPSCDIWSLGVVLLQMIVRPHNIQTLRPGEPLVSSWEAA